MKTEVPTRTRRAARAGRIGAAAAGMVAIVAAAPVNADPTGSDAPPAPDKAAVFLQALDQAGIGHANDGQAVGVAQSTCQRIRDLFSTAEVANDVVKANPGLTHPHAVAFVTIARTVYCPNVGVGELPGYPGQV